jgi:hypothetical protein
VRINKELKKYYQSRIEGQKIPENIDFLSRARPLQKIIGSAPGFARGLIFHLAAIVLFLFVLFSNSGTTHSLQKFDPDRSKAQAVEQKVRKSVERIGAYFKPTAAPSNKGGRL